MYFALEVRLATSIEGKICILLVLLLSFVCSSYKANSMDPQQDVTPTGFYFHYLF